MTPAGTRRAVTSRTAGWGGPALALAVLAGCELMPTDPMDALPQATALPEPTGSWLELGRRLLVAGQPVPAEQAFVRSLHVEGMSAEALTGAGVAAQRQGLLTEAKRYFEHARDLDPASVAAHNNLGAALYGLGELHAARQAFKTAFALSSGTSQQASQNLGMADLAIARAAALDETEPESAEKLHRTGSSTYKLTAASGTKGGGHGNRGGR